MEEKKKLWEKKWFAFLMLLVVAPVVIFSVISLLVKDTNSEDVRPSKYATKDESRKQSGSVNDTEKESKADKVVAEEDGVKVSSFVATVKKPSVKKEAVAPEPAPEPTPPSEPTPTPPSETTPTPITEPVVESKPSSADKQIAAEIDDYVNVFLPRFVNAWLEIQNEQATLLGSGASEKEFFDTVRNRSLPELKKFGIEFSSKNVSGSELREIHLRYVEFDRKKYDGLSDVLRAYDTKDGLLLRSSKQRQGTLASELSSIDTDLMALTAKYGVTLRY